MLKNHQTQNTPKILTKSQENCNPEVNLLFLLSSLFHAGTFRFEPGHREGPFFLRSIFNFVRPLSPPQGHLEGQEGSQSMHWSGISCRVPASKAAGWLRPLKVGNTVQKAAFCILTPFCLRVRQRTPGDKQLGSEGFWRVSLSKKASLVFLTK